MPRDPDYKSDMVYLWHLHKACEELCAYLDKSTLAEFNSSTLLQDAIYWKLNVIGEAIGNLSEEFKDSHPDIPFYEARAVRNRIVHGYDTIDNDIIWNITSEHIPKLLHQITPLIPTPPED